MLEFFAVRKVIVNVLMFVFSIKSLLIICFSPDLPDVQGDADSCQPTVPPLMSSPRKQTGTFLCIDEAFGSRDLQTSSVLIVSRQKHASDYHSRLLRDPQVYVS